MADLPTYDYDIFLSHNHTDQEWTTRLAERLEQEDWQGRKLKVFFSPWDIRPGQSIPKEIENALPKSRKVGLIMSPDAMDSAWVELERLVTTYIVVSARDERLIPLYRRDCNIPALLQPILYIDFRNDARFEESYQRLLTVVREEPLPRGSQKQLNATTIPPTEIPRPPIVGFVPRSSRDGDNLIELLREELAPQKAQLVVLWGAGGVGKTTLAAEAARSLVDDFSHRVVWVSADSRTDLPFSTFLDEVARQLGDDELRKLATERKSEAVRALVISQQTLIVLDNFETISTVERDRCLKFLQHAPCSALITTRQKLEHARSVPITGMSPDEARDFLQILIEQTQDPDIFAASYRDRLIETAESNPLLMEWIVGQIDLANDPEEVLNDLTHGEGDAAHRVFDRSYNLPQLDDGGRAVLLALALFTPSAGRPTLAAVAGMDLGKRRDKERFKKAQETLASLWLIKKMDGGVRLAIAGLTRELTKAHLATDPRAKTFPQRFVSRLLRFAEAHAHPTREDYDTLELEKDNLLGATDVAFSLEDGSSVLRFSYAIATPVYGMLSVRGYWDDAWRIGGLALKFARFSQWEIHIANWSHNLAIVNQRRGEFGEARRLLDESLEISKKLSDQSGIASTTSQLGIIHYERGELSESKVKHEQSLEIRRKLGEKRGIAIDLHQLAMLAQAQGDIIEARRLYNESLEIEKELGDQRGIAIALHQLGTLYFFEGNYEDTEKSLQESLDILGKLGDKQNSAECLESIGKLRVAQGQLSAAETLFVEALGIAEKMGIQSRIGNVKHSLGLLAEKQGDKALAALLLQEALTIFEKLVSPKAQVARKDLTRIEGKSS